MSKVFKICITNKSGEDLKNLDNIKVIANKGIINDRYYNNFKNKEEQVTLINLEEIEIFNKKINREIDPKDFRRNIIVSGIKLNKLIGKKIKINNVILYIHEICQPCNYLQKKLSASNLVKLLVNKSGVRAEILSSGFIEVGNKIVIIK